MTFTPIEAYKTQQQKFEEKYKKDIDFQLKVIVWHILIAKIFSQTSFEKFYVNFFDGEKFSLNKFIEIISDLDLKLNWDNFLVKYNNFDNIDWWEELLWENNSEVLQSLNDSIYDYFNDTLSDEEINQEQIQIVKWKLALFLSEQYKKISWFATYEAIWKFQIKTQTIIDKK